MVRIRRAIGLDGLYGQCKNITHVVLYQPSRFLKTTLQLKNFIVDSQCNGDIFGLQTVKILQGRKCCQKRRMRRQQEKKEENMMDSSLVTRGDGDCTCKCERMGA